MYLLHIFYHNFVLRGHFCRDSPHHNSALGYISIQVPIFWKRTLKLPYNSFSLMWSSAGMANVCSKFGSNGSYSHQLSMTPWSTRLMVTYRNLRSGSITIEVKFWININSDMVPWPLIRWAPSFDHVGWRRVRYCSTYQRPCQVTNGFGRWTRIQPHFLFYFRKDSGVS